MAGTRINESQCRRHRPPPDDDVDGFVIKKCRGVVTLLYAGGTGRGFHEPTHKAFHRGGTTTVQKRNLPWVSLLSPDEALSNTKHHSRKLFLRASPPSPSHIDPRCAAVLVSRSTVLSCISCTPSSWMAGRSVRSAVPGDSLPLRFSLSLGLASPEKHESAKSPAGKQRKLNVHFNIFFCRRRRCFWLHGGCIDVVKKLRRWD